MGKHCNRRSWWSTTARGLHQSIWLTATAGQSLSWTPCGSFRQSPAITPCEWEKKRGFGAQGNDLEKTLGGLHFTAQLATPRAKSQSEGGKTGERPSETTFSSSLPFLSLPLHTPTENYTRCHFKSGSRPWSAMKNLRNSGKYL